MSLADYLAKNYLTADPAPPKKSKKRKRKHSESGLIIADDDALGWENSGPKDADDDGPVTITGSTSDFRKSTRSAWKTVGVPAPIDSDQAAADAIISATAAENALHAADPSDAPAVLDDGGMEMESGARAGLQTAEQVTAAVNRKRAAELSRFKAQGAEELGKGAETIYRDASGRVVNVAMKRAEARKQLEEEEAKRQREIEAQKGDVQRAEREKRREKLEEAKFLTVARYADDEELNQELKSRDRWNDPAAGFLRKGTEGKSVTGKPLYKGPAAPNRYGIRPGHKWDGVDRSNGFEKEYFAARNKRANYKELEYAWQMDE